LREHSADTITLRDLVFVLRRRLGWVIIPLMMALGASTASLSLMTPTYRAVITMVVTSAAGGSAGYDTLLYNRTLAKTYVEVARSRGVARAALERVHLNENPEIFRERVTVSIVRDTEVIAIAVDDTDPQMAARLANTIGEIFQAEFQTYNSLATLRVIDAASPPLAPIKPRPLLYTAIAIASGITAGVGLALLREHLLTPPPAARLAAVPAEMPPPLGRDEAPAPRSSAKQPRRKFRSRLNQPPPDAPQPDSME
jgi:capsular polysaccharide biosynthesis protein